VNWGKAWKKAGIERKTPQHREKNAARLARMVDGLQLVALDAGTSRHYDNNLITSSD